MTKLEQAALDLLEGVEAAIKAGDWKVDGACDPDLAIHRLREALAEQAEQEPVGYFAYDEEHDIWEELTGPNAPGATKLYTAPVRTKDLTDVEVEKVWRKHGGYMVMPIDFARAVIEAFKEKNRG